MKKVILLSCILGFSTLANAQFTEEPKLTKDIAKLISPYKTYSAEVVKTMPDDTYVTLEGRITERAPKGGHDKYIFEDASGSIVVEIDDNLWKGQKVSASTKVKMLGSVDKSIKKNKIKIDAKYLEIIN